MNKKIISSLLAAVMISGATTLTAFASMASGSVVIGNKAFDLVYANDVANLTEITNAIVAGGEIYIKNFEGNWISNKNGLAVAASVIPAVGYKSSTQKIDFAAADTNLVVSAVTISSASDTTLKAVFNIAPADTSKVVFNVKKGTAPLAMKVTWNSTNTIATLTYTSNLLEGTYTVNVFNGITDFGTSTLAITLNPVVIGGGGVTTPVDNTAKVATATVAVVKAETSRLQIDLDAANTLVNALSSDVTPNRSRADLITRLGAIKILDVTAPVLNAVSLAIGQTVSATKDASGDYKVSLAGSKSTDMFTAVTLNASEKATIKISTMGRSKTFTTDESGKFTIPVADILGSFASKDGISVSTLKGYLAMFSGAVTLNVTLKDASGNEKATTITIMANN
ncbi:hypothetical protein [Clostridium tagluense]|uniref:hypothetical protein n=1 Tax=Clostridium tagluense TaxID=360422 RepID=UPI001C6ED6BF|nr:hypothetical protein [Clostridium tagluense]MBW9156991.1 hypothetical protein [Clostridium tagluense]WLC64978.1 hypothetical protein KTC93_19385 [Clostridium tagluense]